MQNAEILVIPIAANGSKLLHSGVSVVFMGRAIKSASLAIILIMLIQPVLSARADLIVTDPVPFAAQGAQQEEGSQGEKREMSFFGLSREATVIVIVVALIATVVNVYVKRRD